MKFIASDEHMAMLKYCSSPPQEDRHGRPVRMPIPGSPVLKLVKQRMQQYIPENLFCRHFLHPRSQLNGRF
jgi:hypothetical protein